MYKTICMVCFKEFPYDGFCCPTMCDECNKNFHKLTHQEDKGE